MADVAYTLDLNDRLDQQLRAAFPQATGTAFLLDGTDVQPGWVIFTIPVIDRHRLRVDFIPLDAVTLAALIPQIQTWLNGTFDWTLVQITAAEAVAALNGLSAADFKKATVIALALQAENDPELWARWQAAGLPLSPRKKGAAALQGP